MVLKHIGVLSAAKISGVMYAAMGLILGLILAGVFSLLPMAGRSSDVPAWLAPAFGIGSLIFMPIMYGLIGFVGGAIGAVIYNVFAGMVGGVELQLEPVNRS